MRLLDVHDLKLNDFVSEKDRPPYAILSHTWGDGEVSFQDLTKPDVESIPGWTKIKKCCEEAKTLGIEYVWVDTCCIDKTSSAELSEAINSMYKWYQSSTICFAYLCDVDAEENLNDLRSQLMKARWFTRGWTLQELIAPSNLIFYNRSWVEIGGKHTHFEIISLITNIPTGVLGNFVDLSEMSIAQRMSWAANRKTTRTEDIAYCLMGIFNVNMPTLYGEGEKAFIRLQHEILKSSDDHSLFAWASEKDTCLSDTMNYETFTDNMKWVLPVRSFFETGLLSTSPQNFSQGRVIKPQPTAEKKQRPFSLTNHGLHVWFPLIEGPPSVGKGIYQAVLDCQVSDRPGRYLTIYLKEDKSTGQYYRIYPDTIHVVNVNDLVCPPPREIFVRELYPQATRLSMAPQVGKKSVIPTHLRLHLPRTSSPRTQYNILESSVKMDSTQGFIDIPTSSTGFLHIGANFDGSVQALVLVGSTFRTGVGGPFERSIEYSEVESLNDVKTGLGFRVFEFDSSESEAEMDERMQNEFAENDATTADTSNLIVTELKKTGWKILVSCLGGRIGPVPRRGISASERQNATTLLQHYRLAISFIPPDTLLDLTWQSPQNMSVMFLPDCLPRVTVEIVPDELFWRAFSLRNVDKPRNLNPGVAFCMPSLHWAEKMKTEGIVYSYQWTPTAGRREAVIALGLQKGTITTLLKLYLDNNDGDVRYLLRSPGQQDLKSQLLSKFSTQDTVNVDDIDVTGSSIRPEDLPDLTKYTIVPVDGDSWHSAHFDITIVPRNDLDEDGPTLRVLVKGLHEYVEIRSPFEYRPSRLREYDEDWDGSELGMDD